VTLLAISRTTRREGGRGAQSVPGKTYRPRRGVSRTKKAAVADIGTQNVASVEKGQGIPHKIGRCPRAALCLFAPYSLGFQPRKIPRADARYRGMPHKAPKIACTVNVSAGSIRTQKMPTEAPFLLSMLVARKRPSPALEAQA